MTLSKIDTMGLDTSKPDAARVATDPPRPDAADNRHPDKVR
ncbi:MULTISPECIES: hypothetical protein [unclassified Frankia]|nr:MULTISPECIES: hypothetical protein [unclassified Frankia]